MANTLTKQFITRTILVAEAYDYWVWVPEVTTVTSRPWGYIWVWDYWNVPPYQYRVKVYGTAADIGPTTFQYCVGYNLWETVLIQGYDTTVTTVPGYWRKVHVPAVYITVLDPNLGWNASARSVDSIIGDGTVSFSPRIDMVGAVIGLNEMDSSSGSDYSEITYGLYFNRGLYRVVEGGSIKTGGLAYVVDDVFNITRVNGEVFYALNNHVFYRSEQISLAELLVDSSLYSGGDTVYDASLLNSSIVELGSATLTATALLEATPKASAVLIAEAELNFTGEYSQDTDDYRAAHLSASSQLAVIKCFGNADLVATSALTAIGHHVNEIHAVMGSMTALATRGHYSYAAINGSFAPMTAHVSTDELVLDVTYLAASFMPMVANGHCGVGTTTLDTVMYMPAMTALVADHAYAEINVSFQPMYAQAGNYPVITGMQVFGGAFRSNLEAKLRDFQNLAVTGTGFATTFESNFGGHIEGGGFTSTLDSTLTGIPAFFIEGGGFTSELVSTITYETLINVTGLGFASSLGANFGAHVEGGGFASSLSAQVTGWASMSVAGGTFSSAVNIGITGSTSLNVIGGGFKSQLLWMDVTGVGFKTELQAAIAVSVSNSVGYILNVHSNESYQWTNMSFSHIINIGNKPYGVTSSGLYLLEGVTDALPSAGTAINAFVIGKESDMGSADHSQRVPKVYLNNDCVTTTVQPIVDGVTKNVHTVSFAGREAKLGRGYHGRYWQFKVSGIVKLEGIHYQPEKSQRYVK